ncbi:MAG: CehA/McbA family metallohydrolase, partial [Candidatus Latescibacteria bacterium]|nr:CehA/McbA family metallohydrolase [Candidatus Latescibacterota bacterium]
EIPFRQVGIAHCAVAVLQSSFTVIPGEEVTCRTKRGKNCHMLAIDSARFISGSGDGGERGLDTATEHSIGEAAAACREWGGFACAAHPLERVPLLERLILDRGEWGPDDLRTPGISGMQIYNGRRDSGFRRGRKAWKKLLLDGYRMTIFGGSDSHGDFNRRRSIELPLLSVGEELSNTLGCVRTVVRADSWRKDDISEALRSGRSVVTDGPFVDLSLMAGEAVCRPGDTMTEGSFSIHARFLSSEEFGALKRAAVYGGIKGEAEERTIVSLGAFARPFEHVFESPAEERRFSYIRAECETSTGRLCLTNPVWLD